MPLTQLEEAITGVVDAVGPSVVTISVVQIARDAYLRPFPVEGMGSGVILREDGLIVTNYHVVGRAKSAEVILQDGRRFQAEYVGGDPESDVALLRANTDGLKPARLGDSDRLRVGQLAIAIGSPFGMMLNGPTVTTGVVSALHRNLQSQGGVIEDLIQSDAPINPGNSGGALLDSSGQVIGINTAIIPMAQGIGFAIPINHVKSIIDEVLAHGKVRRPWLGIGGLTLTPQVAESYELAVKQGVAVFNVEPNSPADVAGIADGDVITDLDARPMHSVEELKTFIAQKKPGDRLDVALVRHGATRTARVTLRQRPSG